MRPTRKISRFTSHDEAAMCEGRYWRRKSMAERVSAVELLRRACRVYPWINVAYC